MLWAVIGTSRRTSSEWDTTLQVRSRSSGFYLIYCPSGKVCYDVGLSLFRLFSNTKSVRDRVDTVWLSKVYNEFPLSSMTARYGLTTLHWDSGSIRRVCGNVAFPLEPNPNGAQLSIGFHVDGFSIPRLDPPSIIYGHSYLLNTYTHLSVMMASHADAVPLILHGGVIFPDSTQTSGELGFKLGLKYGGMGLSVLSYKAIRLREMTPIVSVKLGMKKSVDFKGVSLRMRVSGVLEHSVVWNPVRLRFSVSLI